MTHRYSFGIFPDDWTNAMRLRQRVQGTVQLHRARLTDPTLSLVTFADLHTSLDATLTAAGVPDGCDMALGMLLMAIDRCGIELPWPIGLPQEHVGEPH